MIHLPGRCESADLHQWCEAGIAQGVKTRQQPPRPTGKMVDSRNKLNEHSGKHPE